MSMLPKHAIKHPFAEGMVIRSWDRFLLFSTARHEKPRPDHYFISMPNMFNAKVRKKKVMLGKDRSLEESTMRV